MRADHKINTYPVLYGAMETKLRAANVVASVAIEHPEWTAKQCRDLEQKMLRKWGW